MKNCGSKANVLSQRYKGVTGLSCAEDDERLVVEVLHARLEVAHGAQDGFDGGGGGGVGQRLEYLLQALAAEHLVLGVFGVGYAVGEEDDQVAGLGGKGELFVGGVGEEAQRKAFRL